MRREEISELHYITPIENVASICQRGILSHNKVGTHHHLSVAMANIQARRASKVVPGGLPLHDYVNLYFHARNPMLYVLRTRLSNLCVLRISTDVLDLPDVVITSQNASSSYVRFYPSPQGLDNLDYNIVFADSWTHPDDQIQEWRHKSIKCAEVLVPHQVKVCYTIGAYVPGPSSKSMLEDVIESANINLEICPNSHLFFL